MQIIGRLFREARLQTPSPRRNDELDRRLARVLRINPCLRRAHGHDEHLRTALAWSADHLGQWVAALPAPRRLDAQAWPTDPCLRASFVTADQVAAALADAGDLNGILTAPSPADEACAVLALDVTRGQGLATASSSDAVRRHTPKTAPHAAACRLLACACGRTALQGQLVDRLIDELALLALDAAAKEASPRDMLDCERALLAKRLWILERMDVGMRPLAGGGPQDRCGMAPHNAMLDESDHDLRGLGLLPDAFERQLRRFCDVFLRPDLHLHLDTRLLRPAVPDDHPPAGASEATPIQVGTIRLAASPPRELVILPVRTAIAGMLGPASEWDTPPRLFG